MELASINNSSANISQDLFFQGIEREGVSEEAKQ